MKANSSEFLCYEEIVSQYFLYFKNHVMTKERFPRRFTSIFITMALL